MTVINAINAQILSRFPEAKLLGLFLSFIFSPYNILNLGIELNESPNKHVRIAHWLHCYEKVLLGAVKRARDFMPGNYG